MGLQRINYAFYFIILNRVIFIILMVFRARCALSNHIQTSCYISLPQQIFQLISKWCISLADARPQPYIFLKLNSDQMKCPADWLDLSACLDQCSSPLQKISSCQVIWDFQHRFQYVIHKSILPSLTDAIITFS